MIVLSRSNYIALQEFISMRETHSSPCSDNVKSLERGTIRQFTFESLSTA